MPARTGTSLDPSAGFPPDARQDGFTVNDAQRVDPVLTKQLAATAEKVAAEMKERLTELAPCADATTQPESCATDFIRSFGERAYRRPLDQDDLDALLAVLPHYPTVASISCPHVAASANVFAFSGTV